MSATTTPVKASAQRVYYLDWLRVLAILAVFLYHSNRFFNYGDWHVKNAQLSVASTIFENALALFIMPFMFALSGAAIYYSLKARDAGQYSRERVMRLLVPLITLGMFVFGPIQVYLERLTHAQFTGSFWQFLPHYFEGMYGFGGNFAWPGIHLWYLMLLFIYSFLFLPLFLPSKNTGMSLLTRLSAFFGKSWALFLLFVPLALATHLTDALDLGFTRQMGGWDIFSYMLFFIYGYLIFANPGAVQAIRRYCFASLALSAALTVFGFVMLFVILPSPDSGFFFKDEMKPLAAWLWILAFLGLGSRYLTANIGPLAHANEAVLPFYILHQPVILLVGYFVVTWPLPIPAKYLVIVAVSFVIIVATYELVVSRLNVLRRLFGMKPKSRVLVSLYQRES